MTRFLPLVLIFMLAVSSPGAAAPAGGGGWLTGFPLDKAIRIGTGARVVVEFSDPDCRFSRRMVRYWNLRKDVTRYVFLIALKGHPEAPQKARAILSSKDQEGAYRGVYSGELDFDEKLAERSYHDRGLFDLHRVVADRHKVVATPTYFIDGKKVEGAKVREIERLLGGEKIPFDTSDPE